MKQPLDVRFLGLTPSEAVETVARNKAAKLAQMFPEIIACRITVEQLHKHQHQGRPFGVALDLTVPGHELTMSRVQDEDVYVALRDAFDGMKRQLESLGQRALDRRRQPVPADAGDAGDAGLA